MVHTKITTIKLRYNYTDGLVMLTWCILRSGSVVWRLERRGTVDSVRSEEAAESAAPSPSPSAAETARVVVVGGAGPRVFSSLLGVSLTIATAALAAIAVVSVQGP
jgi:hypothetical protein